MTLLLRWMAPAPVSAPGEPCNAFRPRSRNPNVRTATPKRRTATHAFATEASGLALLCFVWAGEKKRRRIRPAPASAPEEPCNASRPRRRNPYVRMATPKKSTATIAFAAEASGLARTGCVWARGLKRSVMNHAPPGKRTRSTATGAFATLASGCVPSELAAQILTP